MFNLLPGSGLGFTGSKEVAFGLAAMTVTEIHDPVITQGGGGRRGAITIYDNAYATRNDDIEVVEILTILFEVI